MKILIAGDFCPQNRVAERFEHGDFESVLRDVKDIISDADYSIVNFECPVTKGGEKPIIKQGPNLQCSEKGIEAVKWAGFNCVSLANNHFLDYGKEGVEYTLKACKKYGIYTVGGGMNLQEASKILYKEIEGKTLAVVNCCEHEFSIATEDTAGSNPLDPIQQYYSIVEAKTKADYVLVIVHGGHENFQLPSPRMVKTYRFFVDAGADAVVNHHQHCFSGYEVYKDKPIFYGLGNFCFDKSRRISSIWNEGYMVEISFEQTSIGYKLYPYLQCSEKAEVKKLRPDFYSQRIDELNKVISNMSALRRVTENYYEQSYTSMVNVMEPIQSKYILAAQNRGFLPSFLSKKRMVKLQNYIFCEAHRDKMEQYFNNL